MISQRLILAALAGIVAGVAVAGAQTANVVRSVQREGFTANVAGVDVHIQPPSGGGNTVKLPDDAQKSIDHAPAVIGVAVVVVAIAVFVVTSSRA